MALPPEHLEAINQACSAAMGKMMGLITEMQAKLAKIPGADGNAAPANPSDDQAAEYARIETKITTALEAKIKDAVTLQLQDTAKTLSALGLKLGDGPASSIDKGTAQPKKIEDMSFTEVLELEFNKPENQHLKDFEIIKRVITAHPDKHRAAFERYDEKSRKNVAVNGLEKMPARRLPYRPIAA